MRSFNIYKFFSILIISKSADFGSDRKLCDACLSSIESFAKAQKISLSDKELASIILNPKDAFEKGEINLDLIRKHPKLKDSLSKTGSVVSVTYRTTPDQLGGVIAFICDSKSGEVLAFKTLK